MSPPKRAQRGRGSNACGVWTQPLTTPNKSIAGAANKEGAVLITEKTQAALSVLLKLAREERAALTEDLADVAIAKRSAEAALVTLAQSYGPQGERDLARKRRLARALAALDDAEQEAREKLEAAAGLASRLEALTFSPRRAPAGPEYPVSAARLA